MNARHTLLMTLMALALLSSGAAPAGEEPKKDWAKLYPGGIDGNGYKEIVAAKGMTLEIQGGFPTPKTAPSGGGPWVEAASFKVGDTIGMEFHIGVQEAPGLKLSTKAVPAPEPVLYLNKDGKEYKVEKFTKGAC